MPGMHTAHGASPRVHLLDITFDVTTMSDLETQITRWVEGGSKAWIANHNLHSVYLMQRDPAMRRALERADLVHPDGMSLIWWARLRGRRLGTANRITYIDWFPRLVDLAGRQGWRVYYLGGPPGVADEGFRRLQLGGHTAKIRHHHGYLTSETERDVLQDIADFEPHVVFVGMGMPRQELWLAGRIDHLPSAVYMNCGSCIEYFAGTQRIPPRWLGPLGLEWLYRLLTSPRRFWRRYLCEPAMLLPLLARDVFPRRRERRP